MEVYNGAPAESRSDVENRVYAALAQLEIPFTRVDHEPAFTMEDCAAISEALDVHICKNLLLTPRNRSAFYLLCLPAENSFSTKDFSKLIGSSRLSCATLKETAETLRRIAQPGDMILTVGAGDIYRVGDMLVGKE